MDSCCALLRAKARSARFISTYVHIYGTVSANRGERGGAVLDAVEEEGWAAGPREKSEERREDESMWTVGPRTGGTEITPGKIKVGRIRNRRREGPKHFDFKHIWKGFVIIT